MRFMKVMSLIVFIVLASCSTEPQKIHYGQDACHFCTMTIVDKQHASEFVTKKGRSYKFDSVECMLRGVKEQDEEKIHTLLVADYNKPGTLIEAKSASFLITSAIPSPMGANLSAFSDMDALEKMKAEKGGIAYTWETLKEHIH